MYGMLETEENLRLTEEKKEEEQQLQQKERDFN